MSVQHVPNHEKKAFRNLTPEERSAIVEAWLSENTEYYSHDLGGWIEKRSSGLHGDTVYRTRQRKLTIPWEHIKPEYKWAAMDSDGEVILHVEKPTQSNLGFVSSCERVADMLNIDTALIDWRESLVQRPE